MALDIAGSGAAKSRRYGTFVQSVTGDDATPCNDHSSLINYVTIT